VRGPRAAANLEDSEAEPQDERSICDEARVAPIPWARRRSQPTFPLLAEVDSTTLTAWSGARNVYCGVHIIPPRVRPQLPAAIS
jgi:hypothetical protein